VSLDEKSAKLLHLTIIIEELREMRLWLHTVFVVMIMPHQILRQEYTRVEPSADFWVDVVYMGLIDTLVVHEKLYLAR
jgi:hypothetical protein